MKVTSFARNALLRLRITSMTAAVLALGFMLQCATPALAVIIVAQHTGNANPTTEGWTLVGGTGTSGGFILGPLTPDPIGSLNAWRVDDNDTTSSEAGLAYYRTALDSGDVAKALTYGWELTATVRVVDTSTTGTTNAAVSSAVVFGFNTGTTRYQVNLNRVSNLAGNQNIATRLYGLAADSDVFVTSDGATSTYHTVKMVSQFNDPNKMDLFVDNVNIGVLSNFAGNLNSAAAQIVFGALSGPRTGQGNWADVTFSINDPAVYTLDVTSSTLGILKGGSVTATSKITNIGSSTAGTLNYTGLSGATDDAGVATVAGTSDGGPLANSGGSASQSLAISGVDYGEATITADVATATNATFTGNGVFSGSAGQISVTVGNATTNGTSFGTALSAIVTNGGSYAGLESRTSNTSSTGVGANVNEGFDNALVLGTVAKVLIGQNTSDNSQQIDMAWRAATNLEADGLFSDVVDLTGVTGVYALQMTYDEAELLGNEAANAASGGILLGTLDGGEWVNAVDLNTAIGGLALTNQQMDWATFATANSITLANLANYLGSWGVDITSNTVWAVLDHNSEFAVVPEPSSLALLLLSMVGLGGFRKRRV